MSAVKEMSGSNSDMNRESCGSVILVFLRLFLSKKSGPDSDEMCIRDSVVYPLENTKVYDNFVYPMESEK